MTGGARAVATRRQLEIFLLMREVTAMAVVWDSRRGFRGGYGPATGRGRGFGRGYEWYPPAAGPAYSMGAAGEMDMLKAEADYMKKSLEAINKRIDELSKKTDEAS